VYGLIRHAGAANQEGILDRNSILREQTKYNFCTRQKPGDYSNESEFFLDDEGILYRQKPQGKHELEVPKTLVHHIIKENHDPMYIAHRGIKRTYDLTSLNYWWPGMRKSIENYVKGCDSCQRRKEEREFVAPHGEVEEPMVLFQVTSMDCQPIFTNVA